MAQEGAQLGPRPVSGIEIIFRGLSGFIGGALASILTILALAFGGPLLQNLIGDNPNHPIFIFALLASAFFISLITNLLTCLLIGKTNAAKYTALKPALYQVFIANVVSFILMIPIYFIARGFGAELLGYFVAIHWLFAILVSSIIFEVVAALETRNLLLSLYQSFLGFFVTIFIVFLVFMLANLQESPTLLVPIVPIFTWTIIALLGAVLEFLYAQIYRVFGVDFLSIEFYSNK